MASIENKGARASIHTMKALKNVLTACQLSVHLANEGSKSCSKIKQRKERRRSGLHSSFTSSPLVSCLHRF